MVLVAGGFGRERGANFEILTVAKYHQFSLPLLLLFPPLNFFTIVIMVQVSPPSLSSPSGSTGSVAGSGLLDRLQVASLQADLPVSSSSGPSIPSLRNGSPLLTTLRERIVEDEITDGKRGDLQPGESLLGESGLETDIGL